MRSLLRDYWALLHGGGPRPTCFQMLRGLLSQGLFAVGHDLALGGHSLTRRTHPATARKFFAASARVDPGWLPGVDY